MMKRFHLQKVRSILLSAVLTVGSLLFTASSSSAAPSAELAYVTNFRGDTVSVIDTASKKVIDSIPFREYPRFITVTRDGNRAYVGVSNGASWVISVIDTKSKTCIATIPIEGSLYALTITPDGKQVYAAASRGRVLVIDTEKNQISKTISVGNYNYGIAVNPTGTQVYVTYDGHVSVIDTQSQAIIKTISVGNHPNRAVHTVAFTPDGTQAYVGQQGHISVVDTSKKEVTATIDTGEFCFLEGVAFTPDGSRAYLARSDIFTGKELFDVAIINTTTHQIVKTILIKEKPLGITITSDGKEVYVTNSRHDTISVIDTKTYIVRNVIPVGKHPNRIVIAPRPS
jgi:YVTN family beta-propeller protein